jgi:hypothetical protein
LTTATAARVPVLKAELSADKPAVATAPRNELTACMTKYRTEATDREAAQRIRTR